jgi:lipoprotein-releasing system ATP-binding protein
LSVLDAPPSSRPVEALPRLPWGAPGDPVLETRALRRDLGAAVKTRVLDGIDLVIREREFVSLTGLSGSGKSTLLYLLGALDRPTSGQVLLDGTDVGALDDDERAELRGNKLGFVFQFHFLLPEFTVLENVMLPMLRRGKGRRATPKSTRGA